MPTDWQDQPGDGPQIAINARRVIAGIAARSPLREPPTVAMAQQWHRDLYEKIDRPHWYYAGEIRDTDEDFPDLIGYEVAVGSFPGLASAEVPAALARFEQQAQTAAATLDAAIHAGEQPSGGQLSSVMTFCAVLHGEWVRIRPFANGNGRTARVWANWAAIRYGLPPFVTIRLRPGQPSYAAAGRASMTGDHAPMLGVMLQMLQDRLRSLPPTR